MKKFVLLICYLILFASPVIAKDRLVEVMINFDLNAPKDSKNVRLWIPYPVSDEHQNITDVYISGNFAYYAKKPSNYQKSY
ncbi:MAG: hypothetical protein ACK4K4_04960 [Caldimicrobium sp.]